MSNQTRNTIPVEIIYADERFNSDKPEHEKFVKFSYGSKGAAAIDIIACNEEPILLRPGSRIKIPTGVKMWLNDINVGAFMLPRSGIGSDFGIVLGNLTGLIDSDFQGMMKIPLWNSNSSVTWDDESGMPRYNKEAEFVVNPGDRICQMTLLKVVHGEYQEVDIFSGVTERGEGGFGSTKGIDNAVPSDAPSRYMESTVEFTAVGLAPAPDKKGFRIHGTRDLNTCYVDISSADADKLSCDDFPCSVTLTHRLDFSTEITLHTGDEEKRFMVSLNDIPHLYMGTEIKEGYVTYRVGGCNFSANVKITHLHNFNQALLESGKYFLIKTAPDRKVELVIAK